MRFIDFPLNKPHQANDATMIIKHEKEFIERMKSDGAFRERIMSIEDVNVRIDSIYREGYNITKNKNIMQDFCLYQETGIMKWCGLDNYCAHFSLQNKITSPDIQVLN